MDEQKRKRILFWVLALALGFGLMNFKSIMSIGKKRTVADLLGTETVLTPPPTAAAVDSFAYERMTPAKEKRLTLDFGRNPFYRNARAVAVSTGPQEPVLRLSAVSLKGESAFAVVNGKVVKVGDSVEGYIVKSIGKGLVTLSKGEAAVRLGVRGD